MISISIATAPRYIFLFRPFISLSYTDLARESQKNITASPVIAQKQKST
jgi:hypothetical protein